MKRPANVQGKARHIAAGLLAAIVAASVLVICSTSTATVAEPTAQAASSSPTSTAPPVRSSPARKLATAHPDVARETFPRLGSQPATVGTAATKTTAHAYGCAAALAYLHAHAEPHFTILCPAPAYNAQGGPAQAMTCVSHPPQCPANTGVIAISDPCPTAYMNEAANSWIALHLRPGAMDPYGPSC